MPPRRELNLEGRVACIAYTHATRPTQSIAHDLGPFCTPRYLGDEFTTESHTEHLASTDTAVERTAQDILARGDLTEADKVQAQVAEEEAYELFGQRVMALADEAGLSRDIDPQAAYELINFPVVHNGEDLVREFTDPRRARTWMLPRLWGGDGFNLLLLLPQKIDSQIPTFRVVELDALYATNPDALKGLIRDYHEQCAVNALVANLSDTLALHEAEVEDMPAFIDQLVGLKDDTQRSQELQAIGNFISWTALLAGNKQIISSWLMSLPTWRSHEGKYISASHTYASHMTICPAQSDAKTRILLLEQLSQEAKAIIKEEPVSPGQYPSVVALRSPRRVVHGAQTTIDCIEQQISDRHALSDFIGKTAPTSSQAEFLASLQTELPETYRTLQAFQEYLGESPSDRMNNFDSIIEQAAQRILGPNSSEKKLAKVAIQAIGEALDAQARQTRIAFPGIGQDGQGQTIVSHPHLSGLLPLLALQRARATLQTPESEGSSAHTAANIIEGYTDLIDAEKATIAIEEKLLRDWRTAKRVAESLRANVGITETDMRHLAELVDTTHIDGQNPEVARGRLHDSLFNALVLHKRGIVDLGSPIFRSFFASFVGIPKVKFE